MVILPKSVLIALDILKINGYEGYVVGGCVRDIIIGREPADYDITTNALPHELKDLFSNYKIFDIGIKHGTIAVIIDGMQIEITTYRIDGDYSDNRHPSSVSFSKSIYEDLSRRDFTMNAIAYNPDLDFIDTNNGRKDIENKRIVCVGNPKQRFEEDALRILRAIRFSSQLGFEIEEETSNQIHALKENLNGISVERIRVELDKLIMGKNAFKALTEYADVISVFIPEIRKSIGFDQKSRYHKYDIWTHIALAVSKAAHIRNVKLAMLLHDCGKPYCFSLDSKGNGHFYGHEKISAELAKKVMKRLHYDNHTIAEVVMLIRNHIISLESKKSIKKALTKMGKEKLLKLIEVQRADSKSKNDFCLENLKVLDKSENLMYEIINAKECFTISQLALNGYDLMKLGLKDKQIGEALKLLLDKVVVEDLENTPKELREYIVRKYKL